MSKLSDAIELAAANLAGKAESEPGFIDDHPEFFKEVKSVSLDLPKNFGGSLGPLACDCPSCIAYAVKTIGNDALNEIGNDCGCNVCVENYFIYLVCYDILTAIGFKPDAVLNPVPSGFPAPIYKADPSFYTDAAYATSHIESIATAHKQSVGDVTFSISQQDLQAAMQNLDSVLEELSDEDATESVFDVMDEFTKLCEFKEVQAKVVEVGPEPGLWIRGSDIMLVKAALYKAILEEGITND